MTELCDILTTRFNETIVHFITFNNEHIFGTCNPKRTSLNRVIDSFFNHCQIMCKDKENLDIYSDEFKKSLFEMNLKSSMTNIGFSKTTKFILKQNE